MLVKTFLKTTFLTLSATLAFANSELPISETQCDGYEVIDMTATNTSVQNASPSRTFIGQTFVPTEDMIYGITLSYAFSNFSQNINLELRSGTVPDAAPFNVLATANCTLPSSFGAIDIYLEFATPVPVTIGGDYYFVSSFPTSAFSQRISSTNAYPNGRRIQGDATNITNSSNASHDLGFATFKCTPTAPPAPLVPTMSQWALFILGLLLTTLAVVYIRKTSTNLS